MSLSINPINCQKPQLQSHKKPNFTGTIDTEGIKQLSDFAQSKGLSGMKFSNYLLKKADKIVDICFRGENEVKFSIAKNNKGKNSFDVISSLADDESITGKSEFKFKKHFNGKRFIKSLRNATVDINNNSKIIANDIKENFDKLVEKVQKKTDAIKKEISNNATEE